MVAKKRFFLISAKGGEAPSELNMFVGGKRSVYIIFDFIVS